MTTPNILKVQLRNCARCGNEHKDLVFTKLTHASEEWTHYSMCPDNREPIMLAIIGQTDEPPVNTPPQDT